MIALSGEWEIIFASNALRLNRGLNLGTPVHVSVVEILPYSYKFSRDVNFAVFADNVWSTKIKSLKIYIL